MAARPNRAAKPRVYPNRINELKKARGLTNAMLAEAVGAHEVTISELANGKIKLTQDWMKRLAPVFGVRPAELIEAGTQGLRTIRVKGVVQAGAWSETHELPDDEQREIAIVDDPRFNDLALYAGEVRGESMNLRYPPGSYVVFSRLRQRPDEIEPGRRYHVRVTRADGQTEETIKTLVRDDRGRFWLKPESSDPEFQVWMPLEGQPGETIELVGRVRYALQKEE